MNVDLMMFVLDVLRHDFEQVPSIVKMLNNAGCIGWREFWPRDFTDSEVTDALIELTARNLVEVFQEGSGSEGPELVPVEAPAISANNIMRFWFHPSKRGQDLWSSWKPPVPDIGPRS